MVKKLPKTKKRNAIIKNFQEGINLMDLAFIININRDAPPNTKMINSFSSTIFLTTNFSVKNLISDQNFLSICSDEQEIDFN